MNVRDLLDELSGFDPACNVRVGESEVVGTKRCAPRVVGLETEGKSEVVADLEAELNDAQKQLAKLATDLNDLVGEIQKGKLTPAEIVKQISELIP